MQLTEGQEKARQAINRAVKNWQGKPRVVVIRGYAGTGKTTLLKVINKEHEGVIVITPTGKAAQRVKEASGIEAITAHRYLYDHRPDERTGEFIRDRKGAQELAISPAGIIVLDEASMVDQDLWEDIWNAACITQQNIVVIGDPFQLPPVAINKEYFSVVDDNFICTERVDLTEILRQALDSPIIRASMAVREGDLVFGLMDIPRVMPKDLLAESTRINKNNLDGTATGYVICHTNKVRNALNKKIRGEIGYTGSLQVGEPLMVIKNNYEVPIFNGESVFFDGWHDDPSLRMFRDKWTGQDVEVHVGTARLAGHSPTPMLCVQEVMGDLDPQVQNSVAYHCTKKGKNGTMLHANYGYVYTCHKSQGSSASEVLVVMEPTIKVNSLEGRKWLYVALTRAEKEVSICNIGWDSL